MTLVTVLVTDITNLPGTSDAKNVLWARLGAAITAYGGDIEPQRDGSLLAYFEPSKRKDDAERAIRASLAMLAEIRALEAETVSSGKSFSTIKLSIGINTGPLEVVPHTVETIENKTDESATALAAWLQQEAPPGGILISHNTYRYVRGVFNLVPIIAENADPHATTVRAVYYLVESAKPRAFRLNTRGVAGIETRMIGREHERQQLLEAFEKAIHGKQMQFITIVGEEGIGKSRLLYEFQNYIDLHANEVWLYKARAIPQMRPLNYALIRDVFTFRADIPSSDTTATAREKLVVHIQQFIPGKKGEEKAHFIGQLFGFDFAYSPYLRGIIEDGRQVCQRAIQYVVDYFEAVSKTDPVALLLEDIQWADNASLDLIEYLIQKCATMPLAIVCVAQPMLLGLRPNWGKTLSQTHSIRLDPLMPDDSTKLVNEILRKLPERPLELVERIVTGANGNPLTIEERILLLHDLGGLEAQKLKAWEHIEFPNTFDEVILRRFETLTPHEQSILRKAAVIGRHFWDSALAELHLEDEMEAGDQESALQSLQHREFIFGLENTAYAATREYVFKHNLIREVIYETVKDSSVYHGQIAKWRVAHSAQRVREYAGLIAHHFEHAGKTVQAIEYLIRAGKQAHSIGAFEEAESFYARALNLMPNPESLSRRALLTLQLGEVQYQLEQYDRAHQTLKESLRLAEQIGDRQVIADTLSQLGRVAHAQKEAAVAEQHLNESLKIAREIGDRDGMAHNLMYLGELALSLEQYEKAQMYFDNSLSLYKSLSKDYEVAVTFANLAEVTYRLGDKHKARDLAHIAIGISHQVGAVSCLLRMLLLIAIVDSEMGFSQEAAEFASVVALNPATPPPIQREAITLLDHLQISPIHSELDALVQAIMSRSSP